ncbi:MAG: 50S ribosomal protein L23 [Mycoplasmataceae bacterium]|nr:50S ribosomal protein L23 [Mycoplasmataceae bacterium]
MNINDIIIRPIITEKSSNAMGQNVYTFEVSKKATKTDIKRAVESIFAKSGAKVNKVRIMNISKKPKRLGKFDGYKKGYKKAMVYLSTGSIPIYGSESVENTNPDAKPKKTIKIINTEKIMKEAEDNK